MYPQSKPAPKFLSINVADVINVDVVCYYTISSTINNWKATIVWMGMDIRLAVLIENVSTINR